MRTDQQMVDGMEVEEQAGPPALDSLPAELLLHILQFLEVDYIARVVARVSATFRRLARDPATWRVRVCLGLPSQYPALPPPRPFSWIRACSTWEREGHLWRSVGSRAAVLACPTAHYAAVDAVHVMERVVVSGSRDRGISVWGIDQVRAGGEVMSRPSSKNPDMHKGWVWSFCSEGETLVSGSWDSTVKLWQVTPTGLQEARKPINLKVAVLATDILGDRIVTGTFDKKVVLLDRREGPRKCTFYRAHTKPVLAVHITDRQVWSLSEDQSVVIYDRAAGKRLKKVTIPGQHFPICMASSGHCLWVGDKGGGLHLLDTTMDSFDVVESLSSGHSGRVTSLQAGRASLLSASSDGDIRVFRPSRNPGLITVLKNPDCGEATQICYNEDNQILAAGFSNNTVKTWAALPRD